MARLKKRPAYWPFAEEESGPLAALARELWPMDASPLLLEEVGMAIGYAKACIDGRWYEATCQVRTDGTQVVGFGPMVLGCVWFSRFAVPAEAVRTARDCLSGKVPYRTPPGKKFSSKSGFC